MARKMKDSGIEWIGEIPEGWEVIPAKFLFKNSDIRRIADDEQLTSSQQFGIISQKDYTELTGSKVVLANKGLEDWKHVEPFDFIISLRSFQGGLEMSEITGCITWHYIVLKSCHKICSYYYKWLFKSDSYIRALQRTCSFIRDGQDLRYSNFIQVPLFEPPLAEQEKIADYLNAECSHIDAMLAKTRSSIEEYKKLKQAVITQAVTKGVRGKREMKDSGVAWIGEISHDFSLIKLKHICTILDQYRKPISADKRSQNSTVLYDYYGASGVIDQIDGYTIDDHVMLIGEDGANLRMRNLPLMYEVCGKAWINNHAHILKPTERVNFYYLFYALEGLDINPYITGSAQPKLSQEKLQNIWIPLPSLEEQQEIATYIRSKCAEIDGLIAKKEQLVKELESYKKSLIYEVVTGKREV